MSNSKYVEYTRISPYGNANRIDGKGVQHKIKKITPHHMAGVASLETFGNIVTRPGRDMSANYAIGKDAKVGLFLDEKDRPWTSSSPDNDYEAVTIEVSNSALGDPWPISDEVFDKLVDLCVDICERNDILSLVWKEDGSGTLTYHYQVAPKSKPTGCPGPYMKSKTNELCSRVNAKLNAHSAMGTVQQPVQNAAPAPVESVSTSITSGSVVSIASNAVYYNGTAIPDWVKKTQWIVSSISSDRAVLGHDVTNKSNIQSPINVKYLSITSSQPVQSSVAETAVSPYTVNLGGTVSIYQTPGGKSTGTIGGNGGVFTIIAESSANGTKYGKLKSGAGWVIVTSTAKQPTVMSTATSTASVTYKKGDRVTVLNAIQYNGKRFVKYVNVYTILEIKRDRAVISSDGKNVTCAINTKNIKKI